VPLLCSLNGVRSYALLQQ